MSDDNNEFWSNLFSHGSENSQQQQYDDEDSSQDEGQDQGGGQHGGEKVRPRSGGCWVVVLIVVLIVAALLYSGARIGGGGLKGVPGAGGFDAGAKAYPLAQQVESYYTSHSDRRNYCIVALYLEDKDGNISDGPSNIMPGAGEVDTHCEQETLRWVQFRALPKLQTANLRTVHIVLFSQVRVCPDCKPTFDDWQTTLQNVLQQRATSQAPTVALYVFEIRNLSPSGFNPRVYPAGPSGPAKPGTTKPVPVRPQDINQVR